jgi:hypothetical protein
MSRRLELFDRQAGDLYDYCRDVYAKEEPSIGPWEAAQNASAVYGAILDARIATMGAKTLCLGPVSLHLTVSREVVFRLCEVWARAKTVLFVRGRRLSLAAKLLTAPVAEEPPWPGLSWAETEDLREASALVDIPERDEPGLFPIAVEVE